METVKKKHHYVRNTVLGILVILAVTVCVYCYFGGFGTGPSADTTEFAKYAKQVSEITIPDNTRIIALGEATHGNVEFQELKLDVLKIMVERYGVRSFALEADYGCCEMANRFIHGTSGTSADAAAELGFQIYRTAEMAQLLDWMREYNLTAPEGSDLRFYGFDMQRYENNYRLLVEDADELGADTTDLKKIWHDDALDDSYTNEQRNEILTALKKDLEKSDEYQAERACHFVDILLQNMELGELDDDAWAGITLRDKMMAEDVMWILAQEEARGNDRIMISGHNGHVDQFGSYDAENRFMGHILANKIGKEAYYVIGTDFYKTRDNLPAGEVKRSTHTFFSRDPLAKAAKKCGFETCWLDFSTIPEDSALAGPVLDYGWMGSVGENYNSFINSVLTSLMPMSYRVFGSPASMFDSMIFVTNAHPITVNML